MRIGVWHIEEERRIAGAADKANGFAGISRRQGFQRRGLLNDVIVAHQRAWPHIVAVWDTEILVEAVLRERRRSYTHACTLPHHPKSPLPSGNYFAHHQCLFRQVDPLPKGLQSRIAAKQ